MPRPLAAVRVLDFTCVRTDPRAPRWLRAFGAEIVEAPDRWR